MIEELELIEQIVSRLTGTGEWVFVGTILYLTITKLVLYFVIGYSIKLAATHISAFFMADMTKSEAEDLKEQFEAVKSDLHTAESTLSSKDLRQGTEIESLKIKHDAEIEKIKHLYKILKEKKGAIDD